MKLKEERTRVQVLPVFTEKKADQLFTVNNHCWTEMRAYNTGYQPPAMLFWDPFPGVSTSTHPLASGDLNSSRNKVKWNVPSDVKAKTIFLTLILILTGLTVGQQFTRSTPRGQIPILVVTQKVHHLIPDCSSLHDSMECNIEQESTPTTKIYSI